MFAGWSHDLAEKLADGLRAIRESQDPTARLWFGEWRRTRDASHLRRILRGRFYSSLGPTAADVLATQARERGDLAEARRLWLFALENGIPDPTWPLLTAKAAQAIVETRTNVGRVRSVEFMAQG